MTPIICVDHLSKTFTAYGREVRAVRDVSFGVEPGELFGLFGSNGAGKSTLVRMLSTLLAPTSGAASVNGFDIMRDELRVRASLGLVASDERSFYGRLTCRQNLSFYAALQNVPRAHVKRRVEGVLDLFDLLPKADAPFQSLSTGQRQRLNLARALVHDPPILFLDEPTKSMDVQTSDFVKALIKEELVARQRKTIVFISHELYEMDNFCDRVAILAGGELRAIGAPAELRARLPRRAIYRIEVEGDAERIASRWRALSKVETVAEVSRGLALTAFDVTLADELSGVWLEVLNTVGICGGRVEAYRRVDDGSLREVIKHFTQTARNT
ncbi:MAG TPA: ABC transporter ATP-binding protein [Anaerolineae bacterium]|nr:ABC transporter ATP-binding protein [Anaerolineae bacterium]